ncbi:hypothetical protein [Haloarcula onubensis]|uniref:DUF8147 domain-containing protein n=1 Tax=Haloarcula onubensis TaxID=2950539 RepID=A0ABU2FTM3_9EURY|nr:hypothetical protein [Halomicroarcula sp. S3CR25-11]MDS0283612.1 hypothetical protein [Halomicroarcula sp. S3CR25-11]
MDDVVDTTGLGPSTLLAGVGAAATTFLLIATPLVELLDVAFSALVALPLGLLAGLATFMAVALNAAKLHPARRRAVFAYAAFGPAVLAVLALAYVNVGRALLTTQVAVGVGLAATAAVYLALGSTGRETAR